MEIVGRLTDQATVKTLNSGKSLVSFTVRVNESYKSKGEWVRKATYIQCAYWRSTAIAAHLLKDTVVKVSGALDVNTWTDKEGKPRASLTSNIGNIEILSFSQNKPAIAAVTTGGNPENVDDLPF